MSKSDVQRAAEIAELEGLKPYATDRRKEILDAIISEGTIRAACAKLGVAKSGVDEALAVMRRAAARNGVAPGHFVNGTAAGYLMGKVTIQRNSGGDVERTWERQSPDREAWEIACKAAAEAMAEDLPRLPPIVPPVAAPNRRLLNLYTLTDCHVGMLAWRKEGGADWDLKIAEATLVGCFEQMIMQAPAAWTGVVNQLGDFLHSDGLLPITPTSGHILDQDGRFSKMVAVAIRVLRRIIDLALTRHNVVQVVMAEGNHDLASSVWLRQMFKALYENEPRVQIVDSELPYYALQHGNTMLAFHHGHLKKPEEFPLVFAAQYPQIWGQTTKRYAHAGHMHYKHEKEHGGMTVIQHPTLAARDAYAARGGWFADRAATAITYHEQYGEVAKTTVCPEMLEA